MNIFLQNMFNLNDVTLITGDRISAGNGQRRTGSRQNRRKTENAFDSGPGSVVDGHRNAETRVRNGPRRHVASRRSGGRKHWRFRDRIGSCVGQFFLEFFYLLFLLRFSHSCGLKILNTLNIFSRHFTF